jgi:subtilisin family serine protease
MKNKLVISSLLVASSFMQLSAAGYTDFNALPDSIKKAPANWFNLDRSKDGIIGVSTERAYNELLKNKKPSKVVVAIIDSGIETDHEDLKSNIWTNTDEVPDNNKDDDNNGYIDDVNGWDFIGGPDTTYVEQDTWELTRQFAIYSKKFELKEGESLINKDLDEYDYYIALKTDFEKQFSENKDSYDNILALKNKIINSEALLNSYLKTDSFGIEDLKSIKSGIDSVDEAANFMQKVRSQNLDISRLDEGLKYFETNLKYKLNAEFDPRYIVKDNYTDFTVRNYGNKFVEGPDAFHGTHVAGIITANRTNSIGITGISENAEIMVLRVVPSGDERDKDVANAVYYAVDNGAKIINMSFGKDYSPYKEYVDKAFRYADEHGVLIIHAAGNDSKDSDKYPSFPTKKYLDGSGECSSWIEVGASHWKDGNEMAGGFTNYGKNTVDLFAPGVEIYSTTPNQSYKIASGTSMSAPVVTGVATLVLSYYPKLTAGELKSILLDSAVSYKRQKVKKPGNPDETIRFAKLSKTGGIVNAYSALKLAEKRLK